MRTGAANSNWRGGISTDYYRYKLIQKERYPQKIRARDIAYQAIRSGKLIRQNCQVCGSPFTQSHHDDYNKPLEIRWLCIKRHREYHQGIGVGRVQKEEK